jgi:hypothetical protein
MNLASLEDEYFSLLGSHKSWFISKDFLSKKGLCHKTKPFDYLL